MEDIKVEEVLLQVIENERKELPFSMTVKQIEKLLPFSDTKIYEWLKAGKIPGRKIDGKWIVPTSKFLAWFHGDFEKSKLESKIEQQVIV